MSKEKAAPDCWPRVEPNRADPLPTEPGRALAFKLGKPSRKPLNSPIARQDRAIRQRRAEKGESHIQVRRGDFGSRGVSSIIPSAMCGSPAAQQDALSEVETTAVLQIRSWGACRVLAQYALRIGDDDPDFPGARGTQSIAQDLGVAHPRWETHLMIMTTDVVAWTSRGDIVPFFVRYERDLPVQGSRQQQLLKIAEHYWDDRGHSLAVYTEKRYTLAEKSKLIWAAGGVPDREESSVEFLGFLRCRPRRGTLFEILSPWEAGWTDALRRFKHAVAIGWVSLTATAQLPTVHAQVEFRLRVDAERENLLLKNARGVNA